MRYLPEVDFHGGDVRALPRCVRNDPLALVISVTPGLAAFCRGKSQIIAEQY